MTITIEWHRHSVTDEIYGERERRSWEAQRLRQGGGINGGVIKIVKSRHSCESYVP